MTITKWIPFAALSCVLLASPWLSVANSRSRDVRPPSAPTHLAVISASQSSIAFSWKSSRDNIKVAGYSVIFDGVAHNTTDTSYTAAHLNCGTSHAVRVSAFDAAGNHSSQASLVASTARCSTVTTPPVATTPTPTTTTTTPSGGSTSGSTGTTTTSGHTGTTTTTTTTTALVTADVQAPSAPTQLVVTGASSSQVSVSWKLSSDNVGVTGYSVYSNGTLVGTTTGTSYTVIGLSCGTAISIGVNAFDAAGNKSTRPSVTTSTSACVDSTPPTTPGGFTISAVTASGATLGWTASTDSVGVASYVVYANGVQIGQVTATSLAATGLSCGTSYVFAVEARDAAGNRSPQASSTASTSACAVPAFTPDVTLGSRQGNIFVAPNGSDNGASCIRSSTAGAFPSNPTAVCASFMKAYSLAQPGDTILVGPGTYPATTLQQAVNGAVAFRCASATAGACTINGELDLGANNGSPSGNAPSNLTLDGINITNGTLYGYYQSGTPTANFVFENARISDTQDAGGSGIRLNSFQGALIQNVEVGPICCDADGIDMVIPRDGAPSPNGITLDSVNVHDIYDSCALLTAQLPGTPCSGLGYEDAGCTSCAHVDGSQWYGGLNSTIENSTFTAINPGGTVGQGIFLQSANSGLFSNLTITGNTLGATPNNDFSISGPGTSLVSGNVTLTGNHVAGKMLLYNGVFAPGITISVSGNVADIFATTPSNGCSLLLGDGSSYTPVYSGNRFANNQCQG